MLLLWCLNGYLGVQGLRTNAFADGGEQALLPVGADAKVRRVIFSTEEQHTLPRGRHTTGDKGLRFDAHQNMT